MKPAKFFFQVLCIVVLCLGIMIVSGQNQQMIEIKITCISPDEGNAPIGNAYLDIENNTNNYPTLVAWTLSNGVATVRFPKDGLISIHASKIGYSRITRNIETNRFSSLFYETTIPLIKFPKQEYRRTIDVTVQALDPGGKTINVPNAQVINQFGKIFTNSAGRATISHNLIMGDIIDIYAVSDKYGAKSEKLVIGQSRTALTSNNDNIIITLDPSQLPQFQVFTQKVKVLNYKDDQPVTDAFVELKMHKPYQNKTIWAVKQTDANGEAVFRIYLSNYQNTSYTRLQKRKTSKRNGAI